MKRLFILRDVATDQPFVGIPKSGGPLSFPNKKEAKERRDEINNSGLGYNVKVSIGPDHWRAQA